MNSWPWVHFEADVCALGEQLKLAKKWQDEISRDFEGCNELLGQLETKLHELAARASKEDD